MTLRHKRKDIVDDTRPLGEIFEDILKDDSSEHSTKIVNLFMERVEKRGGICRDWVLYVKTLTGRTFDIKFSNPQVITKRCIKMYL